MAGHTPGQWVVRRNPEGEAQSGGIRVDCPAGEAVAKVWGLNEEAVANAHLIAAAPSMEAALQRVIGLFADKPALRDDDEAWGAFSQCFAALAKARAEQVSA